MRLPVPMSDKFIKATIRPVHIDVAGPFQMVSYGCVNYLVMFIDILRRNAWVYSLHDKDVVFDALWDTLSVAGIGCTYCSQMVEGSACPCICKGGYNIMVSSINKTIRYTTLKMVLMSD